MKFNIGDKVKIIKADSMEILIYPYISFNTIIPFNILAITNSGLYNIKHEFSDFSIALPEYFLEKIDD